MIAGGSATGLSATGACIVHVMADDGVTVRPVRPIVQGIWTFILDHIALLNPCENRVQSRYSNLALFVAHLRVSSYTQC
jgi:hypothetical protein